MANCTFPSDTVLTISSISGNPITSFLVTHDATAQFGNTINSDVHITIGGTSISNINPIVSTSSSVSTFLSNFGFKIVDGNIGGGDRTIQIIYPGDIIIAQSIELLNVNLVIMSVFGNVTIDANPSESDTFTHPGVTVSTSGTISNTMPASVSIYAPNGTITNNGTIDTSANNGYINLFANNTINNGTLNPGSGDIVVSNTFINSGTHLGTLLNNPECAGTPLVITSITNTTCPNVSGSTFSFNTTWCVNYSGGATSNFSTSGNSLIITYNGPIEIKNSITMPSNWSLQIITPCSLTCTSDGTPTGTPFDVNSNMDGNSLGLNFIIGGNLTARSITALTNSWLFLNVGGDINAIGGTYQSGIGASAGIGGASSHCPNFMSIISGGNLSATGEYHQPPMEMELALEEEEVRTISRESVISSR